MHIIRGMFQLFFRLSRLLKGVYLFGELDNCYFDRAPQGQHPKQNIHRKLFYEEDDLKKLKNFTRKNL